MRTSFLAALIGAGTLSGVLGSDLDPRLDGKWIGSESISGYFVYEQLGGGQKPGVVSAMLVIGDSGQTFGIVRGLTPGRYVVSPKSHGNTLIFKLAQLRAKGAPFIIGRTDGKLVLSADGNTLTETCNAILPGTPHSVNCVITGTFHRHK